MNRPRFLYRCALLGVFFVHVSRAFSAERFGDIIVAPQSLATGPTFHGYREFRILLQNESLKDDHRVTLVLPDHFYNYGNSISRISRTVSLGPGARVIVPLWQPPLPANGNGLVRVEIDYEDPVTVSVPGASEHVNGNGVRYGGTLVPATVLVSRSLNYDAMSRALKAEAGSYSARMAIGPADSGTRRGMVSTAWMPDSSSPGPHWLELDYDSPVRADQIRICETMGLPSSGEIILTGVSGTNLVRIPISAMTTSTPGRTGRPAPYRGVASSHEYPFPLTPEPVKSVRLDFGSTYAGSISIDAVGLSGPAEAGSSARVETWASAARASSEATISAGPGTPGMENRQLLRAELPVLDWSEYWLSYTPFDAIAVTAADMKAMPAAVLNTLWRYTESGGNLFIFGGNEIPEPWRTAPGETIEGARYVDVGFGQCFVIPTENVADLNSTAGKAMMDAAAASARNWQSMPDENSANTSFPVIGNVKIPVRGIVFIMLTFVMWDPLESTCRHASLSIL